jgi:hypothetical protein
MRTLAIKKVTFDKKIALAQQTKADALTKLKLTAEELKKFEDAALKLHYMK